jgi:KUP system potassium uptake protein
MRHSKGELATLSIAAIGVVYGDIGTSVLYAFKEIFSHEYLALTTENVYGILSLIFWTLTTIVSFKYIGLVLRADNHGEGGLVAMLALASQSVKDKPKLRQILLCIGIFGTCLFYGDGVITPAISVLGAVEGLQVIAPKLEGFIVPITIIILLLLFSQQKRGTGGIGRFFGWIMLFWFFVLAMMGIANIIQQPQVLKAINPWFGITFVWANPGLSFILLGAIILVVTGAEALYADLGHFGRLPIRLAWFTVAMPALTLNYFGQGALILSDPNTVINPFYLMAPTWARIPLLLLATMAAIIASQALISATFSITKQVIQLGYLPRMKVLHTNVRATGQVYIPLVNWTLFSIIVLAVLMFESAGNLASAYGIAVTTDMLITTILTFFVIYYGWKLRLPLCLAATGFFLLIDLLFWSSNMRKLLDGGWFPLFIASNLFILMYTWKQGRERLDRSLTTGALSLTEFLDSVFQDPPNRIEGTAVFLTAQPGIAPHALLHNLKHNKVLHMHNLFVSVHYHEKPWIGLDDRLKIESLGHDCWQVSIHYGFKNQADVPKALETVKNRGFGFDPMQTSYFLSRDGVIPTGKHQGMALWREKLFAHMYSNASAAADYLGLPGNAVVELGTKVEI